MSFDQSSHEGVIGRSDVEDKKNLVTPQFEKLVKDMARVLGPLTLTLLWLVDLFLNKLLETRWTGVDSGLGLETS